MKPKHSYFDENDRRVDVFVEEKMREIKFRAWDTTKGRFVSQLGNLAVTFDGNIIWTNGTELSLRNDLKLMQYTGLKDKNGKEIYEGDIVSCVGTYYRKFKGTVTFEKGVFGVDWKVLNRFDMLYSFKKIGNIYENPELLKDGK
jgi:hypothetical protein